MAHPNQQKNIPARRSLQAAALAFAVIGTGILPVQPLVSAAYAADTLRPEVGKPLQAAQDLMKQQKFKEALAKIGEADAVPKKTAYESFIVERMRGAAASGAGDADTAAKSFDIVIASGKLSNDEQLKIMEGVATNYYRAKEYAKAVTWAQRYKKAGGADPAMSTLIVQSEYLSGDYATAAKDQQAEVAAAVKAGRTPTEDQLQLLASCALKQNDTGGYVSALEELVTYYPKKEYWADLLARVQRKPGFSDRLSLDVYRLMLATGNLKEASDYMEMAQLDMQAGYPKEAQKVINQGYSSNVLGTGSDAERHKRLKSLVDKQTDDDAKTLGSPASSQDGNALVNTGYNLVINGKNDEGIAMMQKGIAAGGLKHPDDAKLHLGEAYLLAGKNEDAAKAFKSVQGSDGTQDLAKLWALRTKG